MILHGLNSTDLLKQPTWTEQEHKETIKWTVDLNDLNGDPKNIIYELKNA